jgi:hypothetical protein
MNQLIHGELWLVVRNEDDFLAQLVRHCIGTGFRDLMI